MSPCGYFILEGVRRSVVAREAKATDIEARIIEAGKPDRIVRIALVDLYTTKSEIPRDIRYIRDCEYPSLVLGTDPPPIDLAPVYHVKRLAVLTPIANVRLI